MGTWASLVWGHRDAITVPLPLLRGSQAELVCTLLLEALTMSLPGCFSAWKRGGGRERVEGPRLGVSVMCPQGASL